MGASGLCAAFLRWGVMDIERFLTTLPDLFYSWGTLTSYPCYPAPFIDILGHVNGMTSPSNMQLLNHAVSLLDDGECYLEVGTWRGATFIGALLGNDAPGYAIDNASMTEHGSNSRDEWQANVEKFGLAERSHYIDASVPAVWADLKIPPIGVYLFDGDKSTFEAARDGLEGVVPFLARYAIIIVDDANTPQIREAVFWFCHTYHGHAAKILDLPTPANGWPCFWNGVNVLGWGVQLER